jgi:hypothetical protein
MATVSMDRTNKVTRGEMGVPVASENVYPFQDGIKGGLVAGWLMALVVAAMILATASAGMLMQVSVVGLLVGVTLHLVLSAGIGLAFVLVLPTLPGSARVWSMIVGPLLWGGAQVMVLTLGNVQMGGLTNPLVLGVGTLVYSVALGWWVSRTTTAPVLEAKPRVMPLNPALVKEG